MHLTVQPVAAIVAAKLAQKLDTPGLMLNFDKLFASDLFGRSPGRFSRWWPAGWRWIRRRRLAELLADD